MQCPLLILTITTSMVFGCSRTGLQEIDCDGSTSPDADAMPERETAVADTPEASVPTGALVIDCFSEPSQILVPGSIWYGPMWCSGYATNDVEDIEIDMIRVQTLRDAASYETVAIGLQLGGPGEMVFGSGIVPAGQNQGVDIQLNQPIRVIRTTAGGAGARFNLYMRLAQVVPWSSNGAMSGVARSGSQVALGISNNVTNSPWNASYLGALNVRAHGVTTGMPILARQYEFMRWPLLGDLNVVRKSVVNNYDSRPSEPMSMNLPAAGEISLSCEILKAGIIGGPTGLKKLVYGLDLMRVAPTWTLDNFKLRRDSVDLTPSQVRIVQESNGFNLMDGSWPLALSTGSVVVSFPGEEIIAQSGQRYCLLANMTGTVPSGDSLIVTFGNTPEHHFADTGYFTGYLTEDTILSQNGLYQYIGPHLQLTPTDPGPYIGSKVIWSDLSEGSAHSSLPASRGGSGDWTDDTYLSMGNQYRFAR